MSNQNGFNASGEIWGEAISSYTQGQAIDDGYLIDVTREAKRLGFVLPVVLTNDVWQRYVAIDETDAGRPISDSTTALRLSKILIAILEVAMRFRSGEIRFSVETYMMDAGDWLDNETLPNEATGRTRATHRTVELKALAQGRVITVLMPWED